MRKKIKLLLAILMLFCFTINIDSLKAQNIQSDLDTLLELAASESGGKRFEAILKLRDVDDNRAIPVLEKILAEHIRTTDIFGFAAAQALFCIGTQEAHEILSKFLPSNEYETDLGIDYTFHWDMEESKRNAFIEQYHLQSTSKDMEIEVKAKSLKEGKKQKIKFTVILKNVSKKPLRIYNPGIYLGNLLILRHSDGNFMRKIEHVEYKHFIDESSFPVLEPGKSQEFHIDAEPRLIDSQIWKNYGLPQPQALVLDCGDMLHPLNKPGKFIVYAMFHYAERFTNAQAERLGLSGVWTGRVVSRPIEIDIESIETE